MTRVSSTSFLVKSLLRPQHLHECVRSIRASYPTCPILVADDSGSKRMAAFLDRMAADEHLLRVIHMPYDAGIAAGRNLLVDQARTEYVVLCDDDFTFRRTRHVSKMLALIGERDGGFNGPPIDVVCGRVRRGKDHVQHEFDVHRSGDGIVFSPKRGDFTTLTRARLGSVSYQRVDVGANFLVAKSAFLRAHPWDQAFRAVHEHHDWFFTLKYGRRSAVVVSAPDFIVDETTDRYVSIDPELYEKMRHRRDGMRSFYEKWHIAWVEHQLPRKHRVYLDKVEMIYPTLTVRTAEDA